MRSNGVKKRDLFIQRSLKSAVVFLKESVFSDEVASSKGLLQAIVPGIKIALLVMFLVITIYAKSMPVLLGLYLLSIVLALMSGLKLLHFLGRVWFFIPIFTLLIAIPAVFTEGLYFAGLFVLRVTTCVSYAVLFTVTTKHSSLLRSLTRIGVPEIFVHVLDMTYRYIFLFIKAFEDMHLALNGRLLKRLKGAESRRWIASRIAFLFKRSMKMSEDVYMAMTARGYRVEVKRYGR